MRSTSLLSALAALFTISSAHLVVTYPGWRGDNLKDSGKLQDGSIPQDGLGVRYNNQSQELEYPYGMQWIYPCGGMPTSTNRTKWGINGGAIAFQPGWFSGHQYALMYLNLGLGNVPLNMSLRMMPVFQITGPDNNAYPGTFCIPQVPLPPNITVNVGDNATIQIVETAQHGAALYSCVDITFADPKDVPEVNSSNCFNSSVGQNNGGPIGQNFVYTAPGLTAGSSALNLSWNTFLVLLFATLFALSM